jgi:hypothetical protein
VASWEWHKASVNLNARDDACLLEAVYKGGAVSVVLEESLLVQDGSRDVVSDAWAGEEQAWQMCVYSSSAVEKKGELLLPTAVTVKKACYSAVLTAA